MWAIRASMWDLRLLDIYVQYDAIKLFGLQIDYVLFHVYFILFYLFLFLGNMIYSELVLSETITTPSLISHFQSLEMNVDHRILSTN